MKKQFCSLSFIFTTTLLALTTSVNAQKAHSVAMNLEQKDTAGRYVYTTTLPEYIDQYLNKALIDSLKGKMLVADPDALVGYSQIVPIQLDYLIYGLNEIRKKGCKDVYSTDIDSANFADAFPKVLPNLQSAELKINRDTLRAKTTGARFDAKGAFTGVQWEVAPFTGTYPVIVYNGCGNQYPLVNRFCENNFGDTLIFSVVHGDATVTKLLEKYQPKTVTVTDTTGKNGYHFSNTASTSGSSGSTTINNLSVVSTQTVNASATASASAPVSTTTATTASTSSGGGQGKGFTLVFGVPNMASVYGAQGYPANNPYNPYVYQGNYNAPYPYYTSVRTDYGYQAYGWTYHEFSGWFWEPLGNCTSFNSSYGSYTTGQPVAYCSGWNASNGGTYSVNAGGNNQVAQANWFTSPTGGPHMERYNTANSNVTNNTTASTNNSAVTNSNPRNTGNDNSNGTPHTGRMKNATKGGNTTVAKAPSNPSGLKPTASAPQPQRKAKTETAAHKPQVQERASAPVREARRSTPNVASFTQPQQRSQPQPQPQHFNAPQQRFQPQPQQHFNAPPQRQFAYGSGFGHR